MLKLWKRGGRSGFVLALGLLFIGVGGSGPESSHAQSHVRVGPPTSVQGASETTQTPSVGRVLLGSTVGTGVGTGVGLLLLKAAADAVPDDESSRNRDGPEEDAAATLTLIGAAAIIAGGPIGAVEIGGIEHRRRDAYVMAGVGEILLGAAGYALARSLSDATTVRLMGLGAGVTMGAAGGAYWIASQSNRKGLFSYQTGKWYVAPPDVRVRPRLTTERPPSVGVTLVSAQF